jgi:hypothetical protein
VISFSHPIDVNQWSGGEFRLFAPSGIDSHRNEHFKSKDMKQAHALRLVKQAHALRLVSGATMHLMSVALCVTRASVYDAAGCALTIRRAAQSAEDRT